MRGLIIGRFQPFHIGHLALARQAASECDEVIIAVTGSQFNYLAKDPFTAGERIEMIREALRESGVDLGVFVVLGLENQRNVATWPAYIRAALPSFQRVYSGNPYVEALLRDYGVESVRPVMVERDRLNATALRRIMADGGEWRGMVPPAVARVIESVNGEERVRMLLDTDTDPTTH